MTEVAVPQRTEPGRQGWGARWSQWFRRAVGAYGPERQTLELIGKSTLAAGLAWFVAENVMHAQTPGFAPFSAFLMLQVTVYQSLWQTLRYVGAVVVGVALQGAFGAVAGPGMASFVLVTLAAVIIGRWRHLGSQGPQVATAAFFAFSTYAAAPGQSQGLYELGQIILLVLIGCGVGVSVNVLVLPPMRYRNAEAGIHALGRSLCDLVADIYPALREGALEKARTERWRQRASSLTPLVTQAQASVRTARESTFYNPRRLFRRHRGRGSFAGYQRVIDTLERVTYQVASMARSLDLWQDRDDEGPQHREFLYRYGDLLAWFSQVSQVLSQINEDRLHHQSDALRSGTEEARECQARLAEWAKDSVLPLSDPGQPYGILLAEAGRLSNEIDHTCRALQEVAVSS
jgi:uncharacterized membrane protein YgaE (UPF0421/DUF939 family)